MQLGELEEKYQEFAKRGVRVMVVSNDNQADSEKTQKQFPHLQVITDTSQMLAKEFRLLHPGVTGPDGLDTNVPTMVLVDGDGRLRWMYRSPQVIERPTAGEVLDAIDEHLAPKS